MTHTEQTAETHEEEEEIIKHMHTWMIQVNKSVANIMYQATRLAEKPLANRPVGILKYTLHTYMK